MKANNKIVKKVFVSAASDRGILVKFSKNKEKVSISFWGNDDPKNISFSKEEALDICEYIMDNTRGVGTSKKNIFEKTYKNMKTILPETHL
tara:strand:+ start:63 stop:335 length:273 start_codon:yes stop_codon:yes gene_type:complete